MSSGSGRRRWGVGPRWIKAALHLWGLAVAAGALVGVDPGSAIAQAPDEEWRTLETAHFRVTFPAELEALGREAADRAERAYDELKQHFIEPPDDRIDLPDTRRRSQPSVLPKPDADRILDPHGWVAILRPMLERPLVE